MGRQDIFWTLEELAECLYKRQKNKFDVVMMLDGPRGSGKSTFVFKLFKKIGRISGNKFKPKKDIMFTRDEVMDALDNRRFGLIFADEMINAAHNRDFFSTEQKELIKMINMYRDHHNVLAGCVPYFYDLDNQVRKFVTVRITIIKRGLAVVQFANSNSLYNNDPWQSKINEKIEFNYLQKIKAGKKARKPFQKLTTFGGYVKFGKLHSTTELIYQTIKDAKRREIRLLNSKSVDDKPIVSFYDNTLEELQKRRLDKESFMSLCKVNGIKYSAAVKQINMMLKDMDAGVTYSKLLKPSVSVDYLSSKNLQQKKSHLPKVL